MLPYLVEGYGFLYKYMYVIYVTFLSFFSILLVLDQNGRKRKTRSYSRAGEKTLVGHTPWGKA